MTLSDSPLSLARPFHNDYYSVFGLTDDHNTALSVLSIPCSQISYPFSTEQRATMIFSYKILGNRVLLAR
jgi:hypothetical protein